MKLTIEQHLLVCLGEEGGEIAKECAKALRFGIDDRNFLHPEGPNNRERIVDELNDLMGVVEFLVRVGTIPPDWKDGHKIIAKMEKLGDCMEYAKKAGTLK